MSGFHELGGSGEATRHGLLNLAAKVFFFLMYLFF